MLSRLNVFPFDSALLDLVTDVTAVVTSFVVGVRVSSPASSASAAGPSSSLKTAGHGGDLRGESVQVKRHAVHAVELSGLFVCHFKGDCGLECYLFCDRLCCGHVRSDGWQ